MRSVSKVNWLKQHRRHYRIADITIQVDSDLLIDKGTFHPKFRHFEVTGPGEDNISIRHHFFLPDLEGKDLGKALYHRPPWAVYRKGNSWIYLWVFPIRSDKNLHRVMFFNFDHTRAIIYNNEDDFLKGNLHSLTLFPNDVILLARILADRQGCYLHSCGVNFEGKGLLFVGHSETGKSTMARLLRDKAEILCDDRMIIRKWSERFRIYGTWSHGDVPNVSANSVPLRAILFLEKAQKNSLTTLTDKKEITKKLLACLIKPFVTVDWWDKTLSLIEEISDQVPCYVLKFDKSSKVVEVLRKL